LIGTDTWIDLISGHIMSLEDIEYQLTPYQSMWISNICSESFNLVR
jgi:sucrose phosphorylase